MSHIVKIKTLIRDLDALRRAAQSLGLEMVTASRFKYFANKTAPCDYALRVPGNQEAYEIGISKNGDHYEMQWDSYAGGYGLVDLVSTDGRNADRLSQAYAREVVTADYENRGYRVSVSSDASGNLVMEAYK
jgi:hypothetical protein